VATSRNPVAGNKNKMRSAAIGVSRKGRDGRSQILITLTKEHIRARIGFLYGHGFAVAFIRGGTNR
jgi:hypothetical protein